MGMVATGCLAERMPGLYGDLTIGFRGEIEDDFGRIDVGLDARTPLRGATVIYPIVQVAEATHFVLGIPADPLATVSELVRKRANGRETTIRIGIVALDHRDLRRGDTRHEVALALLPVPHRERLGKLGGRVMQDWGQHHVALDPQMADRKLREAPGDLLIGLPVAAGFPNRVHRG